MAATQTKGIGGLRFLHVISVVGVLFSLVTHKTAGLVVFGVLAVGCSLLISRIARQNPAIFQGRASKVYVVCMWAIAGCIALVLIGVPYLGILMRR